MPVPEQPRPERPYLERPYLELPFATDWGVRALVTTRAAGSFSTASDESVALVMGRWSDLRSELGDAGLRFATASQVHGPLVFEHATCWAGWLRAGAGDGHLFTSRGCSAAVTVADCVPVFVAHPSGAAAVLHAGWRGTAAGILEVAIRRLEALGMSPAELRVHTGPAICGGCYEVGPEVATQLTGRSADGPVKVDLRAILADRARAVGVRSISQSEYCTRCDGGLFFSHRAGDAGRQLGVLALESR